jgi:hypothetical protein
VNVDHFVLDDAPQVMKVYGDKPKSLDVVFRSDNLEAVAPTWLKWHDRGTEDCTGKVKCRGNGPDDKGNPGVAKYYAKQDLETGLVPTRPCLGEKCPDWVDAREVPQCSPVMDVYVMLPKVTFAGVFKISMTSQLSIKLFHDELERIRQLNQGRIALIPFKLVREELQVRYLHVNRAFTHWITVIKPNEDKEESQQE